MLEILFALGQIVCVAGYLYGGWLVLSHVASMGSRQRELREDFPPRADPEDREAWKRYLASDV